MSTYETLTDADFEKQPTLKYKKGSRVRVKSVDLSIVKSLEDFIRAYGSSEDPRWRESAVEATNQLARYRAAVGKEFVIEEYTIGYNPHGIYFEGRLLYMTADCLEAI